MSGRIHPGSQGTDPMPYYEFECRECGHAFIEKQTFAEHDKGKKVKCPKCGSEKAEHLVGAVYAQTAKKS